MRIGLIGFGAWGKQHAAAIERLPGVALAGIAAHRDAAAAEARALYPNATVVDDYRDLLARDDIDMVDIVTPNHLHADMGCDALAAGKHVLLEKPLANTLADCDRLIAAERVSGKRLSVGHELRLSTQWGLVKREIAAGRIGEPRYVNITLFRNHYREGAEGWRYDPARVGSWSLEETVHFFDLALWYLADRGDPVAVRAMGAASDRSPALYDSIATLLRFPGNASAVVSHSTAGFGHYQAVEVTGSDGAIRTYWQGMMDRDEAPAFDFRIRPKDLAFERGVHEFEQIALDKSSELVELERQIALTAEAFARNDVLVTAAEARKAVAICLAAEESAARGEEVALAL